MNTLTYPIIDLVYIPNLPEEVLHHMFMKKGPVPAIVTTNKQLKDQQNITS